jgi:hypothetical protein
VLELEDESLAVASSLLQAPRPRAALRAIPATISFFGEIVDLVMVLLVSVGRCRGHSGRTAERIARNLFFFFAPKSASDRIPRCEHGR